MQLRRIKQLREEMNDSQHFLAEQLNISPASYQKLESGNRTLKSAEGVKLALLYGVPLDYIVELTDCRECHARNAEG